MRPPMQCILVLGALAACVGCSRSGSSTPAPSDAGKPADQAPEQIADLRAAYDDAAPTPPQGVPAPVGSIVAPHGEIQMNVVKGAARVTDAELVIRRDLVARARQCYQRALNDDPTVAGSLALSIDVAPTGEVQSVTPGGLTGPVAACTSSAAKRLQFAAFSGGGDAIVQVSFALSSH